MKKELFENTMTAALKTTVVPLMKSKDEEITADSVRERMTKTAEDIVKGVTPAIDGMDPKPIAMTDNNRAELTKMVGELARAAFDEYVQEKDDEDYAAQVQKAVDEKAHKEAVAKATPKERAHLRNAPLNDGTPAGDVAIARSIEMMPISKYAQRGENTISLMRMMKAIKQNDWSIAPFEQAYMQKALTGQVDEFGGYLVPDPILDQIIELLREQVIVQTAGARVIPMSSATLGIPVLTSGSSMKWEGADNSLVEQTAPKFGMRNLIAKKATSLIPIPNDWVNDTTMNVEQIVLQDMAKSIGQGVDTAQLVGLGTTEPVGIANFPGIGTTSAINLSVATIDTIRALILKTRLQLSRATAILTHPTVTDHFMSLKDAAGRPLVNPDPKNPDVLKMHGLPIFDSVNCIDAAGTFPLIVAPMDEVIIGQRTGISLARSSEAGFTSDVTWLRAILRTDLTIARPATVTVQRMNDA